MSRANAKNTRISGDFETLAGSFLVVVGLLFFLVGFFLMGSLINDWVKTEARVLALGDSENPYVKLEYEYQGARYTAELYEYADTWSLGKMVNIRIDPENPRNCRTGASMLLCIIFSGLGAISAFIGVMLFKSYSKKKAKKKWLFKHGDLVQGKITKCYEDGTITINDRYHPYRIVCIATDANGQERECLSEPIREDPKPVLAAYSINSLPVHIDQYDRTNYYVDVSEIKEHL